MIDEKKKETVADFLKRGGKIKKVKAGMGKEGKKKVADFKKSFKKTKDKEAELDAKDREEREKNESLAYEMNNYVNVLQRNRNINLWSEAKKVNMFPPEVKGKKTMTGKPQQQAIINPKEKEE